MSKSKVPYEEKAEIVRGYLEERVGYTESLGRANNSEASFRYWVHQYQEKGIERLLPSRKNHRYPEEIKRKAVEDYLSGKGSLEQIGGKYGLRSITQLRQWIKVYNAHEDFNFRKNSGGGSSMPQARTRATGDLTMICVMTTASMSMTSGCSASAGQRYPFYNQVQQSGLHQTGKESSISCRESFGQAVLCRKAQREVAHRCDRIQVVRGK